MPYHPDDPRIVAAAQWLQNDDSAYEGAVDAMRAAVGMLTAADAVDPLRHAILNTIPPDLLFGLPDADQLAIRAAVGQPVILVGYDELGRAEIEFKDAADHIHTIWVDPASIGIGLYMNKLVL